MKNPAESFIYLQDLLPLMPLETIQSQLYFTGVFVALITAVIGIISLNVLFRDKLKELFTDKNFFIFFFMIFGYLLSALGELLWFLIFTVFGEVAPAGMQDVYSVAASLFILMSFVLLTFTMFKTYGESRKIVPLLIGGAALVMVVMLYNSAQSIFLGAQTSGHIFLAFFYPITTSLIVTFSASVLFFWRRMAVFGQSLLLLFIANVAFLLADVLYLYTTVHGYGVLGVFSSLSYISAYGLSSLAFIALLVKARRQ